MVDVFSGYLLCRNKEHAQVLRSGSGKALVWLQRASLTLTWVAPSHPALPVPQHQIQPPAAVTQHRRTFYEILKG